MPPMDFELSEDQLALQGAARNLLDDRADHQAVRAHLSSGRPFDAGLWHDMADQGWLGVALPEAQGGIGMSWVEAAVLLEEIGRHSRPPVPFLSSLLALTVLATAEHGAHRLAGRPGLRRADRLRGLEQAHGGDGGHRVRWSMGVALRANGPGGGGGGGRRGRGGRGG